MLLYLLARRGRRVSVPGARRPRCRPRLEGLEDRIQPSTLAALTNFPTGTGPNGVVTADFNRDNIPDLATANFLGDSVSVLLGNGDGSFRAAPTVTGLIFPEALAAADFNRDGNLDLAVGNNQTTTVTILLGTGTGTFTRGPKEVVVERGPDSIAVADFNRDGRPDLAVASAGLGGPRGVVSIRLGLGNGTFRNAANVLTGPGPTSVAVGRLNADRYLDLVVANSKGNTLSVRLGRGNGTFRSPPDVIVDTAPSAVAVGDFNDDGKLDLAASSGVTSTVSVRLGNGTGRFRFAPALLVGPGANEVVVADFDRDARPDLAVVSSGDDLTAGLGSVAVFLGQGNGEFGDAATVQTCDTTQDLAVGDFDRDGKLDFAATNFNSNNVSVAMGLGDGRFATAVATTTPHIPGGQQPSAIVEGDFDRDGNLDVLVANEGTSTVTALLGTGNGTFHFPIPSTVFVGSVPRALAAGDFDRDGKLDFLTANFAANTVSVRLGNGDGTFRSAAPADVGVGLGPLGVVVGHFDSDGNLDFATVNFDSGDVSVRLGNGDGTFRDGPQPEVSVGGRPSAVAIGTFDQDGLLDLAVTDFADGTVRVLLGGGDGSFTPVNPPEAVGRAPRGVAVGDFNGDARLDLVTANAGSNNVSVLLGRGDGTFGPAIHYAAGQNPVAVTVADLDRDGGLDLVVADNGFCDVSVLLGNENGTFQPAVNYLAGASPDGVVVGDFNKDGKPDVAVSLNGSDGVNLLLN